MRRTQIQLDDRTYEVLRRRAFERGCSISSYVREVLADSLGSAEGEQKPSIEDFSFIGAGRSRQGRLSPVSERHDEALAQAPWKDHRL